MEIIYEVNGLPFWTEKEITLRRFFEQQLYLNLYDALLQTNTAWKFFEVEAPILTPRTLINPNYTEQDIWVPSHQEGTQLVLRPETTPGSYAYMVYLLNHYVSKPPFCVYQTGKSFRREQDQTTKHCRFKEFYQMEFQCLFTSDTKNDYHAAILPAIQACFANLLKRPTRITLSDRLPFYSLKTVDIEVETEDKETWMEVCSISLRNDFPIKAEFGCGKKDCLVLEIAAGLDRLVYLYQLEI